MSSFRVLIIEDEPPASNRLAKLLKDIDPEILIVDRIDTVSSAIKYLQNMQEIDLIFMDIQLSDGLSFEIFSEVEFSIPVIFTTAFDGYTLNAFKVHSVDYLLKPIEPTELKSAYQKFKDFYANSKPNNQSFKALLNQFLEPKYKERFLIKSGSEIKYIQNHEIAYFYSEDGYSHICSKSNRRYIVDYKLDEIEKLVDPQKHFRINRKHIVNINSIKKIESYFNSRYKLKLDPDFNEEVIVSRDRSSSFKGWLDQ